MKRHGETPIVVNAVAAHHEEVKPETVYAGLVILADTVSAARPGARAESMTSYIQRLDRLEKLALALEGVQQAYAIQAGARIRVVVSPQQVTDERAREIAKTLRTQNRRRASVSSTIKITVIRESRYTETAHAEPRSISASNRDGAAASQVDRSQSRLPGALVERRPYLHLTSLPLGLDTFTSSWFMHPAARFLALGTCP